MFTDKLTLAIAEAAKKCMEEGSLGYVAFGHDGKRHEVYANSSYEAKQKAVSHFKTPKSKQHLVSVTLAQKDGKDVVHTATESVQESKLDDILDARRAKEADGYAKTEKPVAPKKEVPGIRYGGKNQKPEKETEIEEGAVPSTEKTVTVKHKTSGKELVVTAKSVPEYVKGGYHPVKESMSNPGLESFASKVRAERTGKASNPALEKIAHEKAKEKYLKKEEVEELDEVSKGLLGRYITKASLKAAGHAYKARDTSSNDNKSGEHIDKTFKRLDGIKTAVSKLAKEEVEELDELDKKTLGSYVKKSSEQGKKAAVSAGQSNQALGRALASGNKHLARVHQDNIIYSNELENKRKAGIAKAVDKLTKEEVDMGQADRTLRQKEKSKNTYHVKDSSGKIISTHDNHSDAMRGALKHDNHKVVKEAVESTNQHYVMAHNRARGFSSIVKKDGEYHLHPSKEAASEHAGKLNAKSSSPHVYYTYGGNINEDTEDLNESKAHIEQHLADRDINSKVTGKVVKVHSSDVTSTKKHIQKAGYKDHKVVGGLNEEKMSDEDMEQREKIVKGMKKNLQGFKARYGDRAKDVMYATATKQAMKEGAVPSTEKTVKVKHATSGKEIVVTAKSADKYKAQGYHPVKEEFDQIDEETLHKYTQELIKTNHPDHKIFKHATTLKGDAYKKYAHQQDTDVRDKLMQYVKEDTETLNEREASPTAGTRKIASYGDHAHTAEVRYNPEYQEYQVHHYKAGKHQGEGPVSYHYEDKADAHGTAKRSVGIKEEVEQIDELSKKTLGSYVKKVALSQHYDNKNFNSKETNNKDTQSNDEKVAGVKKSSKRTMGVMNAINRLTKEEVTNDGFKAELEDNKAKAAGTKKQPDIAKASVQAVKQESFSSKLTSLKEGVRSYLKGRNNG
jgi:hypothetical protein